MVRGGRGYSFSGQREMRSTRGSYRGGSSSNYYSSRASGSSRGNDLYNSRSNHGSYRSSQYDYDSRSSRDKHSERDNKRHFSSRERSPDRKRSRHDSSRLDSSYSTSSYRRSETTGRSGRQTPPPPNLSSISKSSTSYQSSSRRHDGNVHRRPVLNSRRSNDPLGPPRRLPPRSRLISSSRGSLSRLRGSSRFTSRLASNSRLVSRRGITDMRIIRRKMAIASQNDRSRRIRLAKIASSLRRRRETEKSNASHSKSTSRKSHADKTSKVDDDQDRSRSKSSSKESKKKIKSSKSEGEISDSKGKEKSTDEKEEAVDDEDQEVDLNKIDEDKKCVENQKLDKKSLEKESGEKKSEKKSDRRSRSRSLTPRAKRSFIKLKCVHCRMKCLTFQDYNNHLYLRVHKISMRRLALRQKAQLSAMRMKQRNAQREIEESSKDDVGKPQFCMLCRLNYRIPKEKHQLSEHHRNMKKFLMPYCSICRLSFQSPMVYENHRCSLDHIKRKARTMKKSRSQSSDEEREVDLANFTTVDSVGEIDYQNENEENSQSNEEDKEKVLVGTEYVKKTEAFYCELCRLYFSAKEEDEIAVKRHCATRSHLKSYLRRKEDQHLKLEAERVQLKENKEKTKCEKTDEQKQTDIEESTQNAGDDDEDIAEDKLWQDVDKDLGDLLREVGPKEDEEDESMLNSETERFDKFKNSENSDTVNGNCEDEKSEVENEIENNIDSSPIKQKEIKDNSEQMEVAAENN